MSIFKHLLNISENSINEECEVVKFDNSHAAGLRGSSVNVFCNKFLDMTILKCPFLFFSFSFYLFNYY